jgi:D-lyxose ketol-isomerase
MNDVLKHIGNIYKTDELNKYATCSIMEQVANNVKAEDVLELIKDFSTTWFGLDSYRRALMSIDIRIKV